VPPAMLTTVWRASMFMAGLTIRRSCVPGDNRKPPPQLVARRRPPSRISTGTVVEIVTHTGPLGVVRLTGGFGGAAGGALASTRGGVACGTVPAGTVSAGRPLAATGWAAAA